MRLENASARDLSDLSRQEEAVSPGGTWNAPPRSARLWPSRLLFALEKALERFAGAILAALLGVVLCSVLGRYAGADVFQGLDELATWLYILLVFAGFPLVPGSPLAMRMDSLRVRLHGRWRAGADVFGIALIIHASLLVANAGIDVIRHVGGAAPLLGLPEWLRFAAAPLAGALGCLLTLLRLLSERRSLGFILSSLTLGLILFEFGRQAVLWQLSLPSAAACLLALAGLLLGAPLAHALLSSLSFAIPFGSLLPQAGILQNTVAGVSSFLLLAIPFFILAGALISATSLADKLVALANSLVGHRRGGLAQTTLLTNVFFSGISGSSLADVAFGVKVLTPGLIERGYAPERAAGIVCATAILPNIIPPSVAFLMLAVATDLSVGALFMGGLVAGLFLALVLACALHFLSTEKVSGVPATRTQRVGAFLAALPVIGLAVIIFSGIRLGLVTTTEAGALACAYALLLSALWLRGNGRSVADLGRVFATAGREAAAVGLLIGASMPFMFVLAVDGAPAALSEFMSGWAGGPFSFLLAANLILLVFGLCLEVGVGILLLAPLMLPAAVEAGLDPIHFGIILVINLMIGGLTPPVGMIVFVASGLCGLSADKVFKSTLPLLGALLLALACLSALAGIRACF
ncbi:MAG: TRAP transporter large permease subunit [Candidatus Accumulibacter sp.]|nr:TRAP transporter large permease subunit [Accumulibacter sp.]